MSFSATLAKADFQALTDPEQMRLIEAMVERLARQMRKRAVRRQRDGKRGSSINLRRTLRDSLRYGGNPLVCSAVLAVVGTITEQALGANATAMGRLIADTLAADTLGAIGAVEGVINTVLIYHYGGDDIEQSAGSQ